MNIEEVKTIVRKYVGIPFRDHGSSFDGCDCYGLVCLLYKTEFNLILPQIGDLYNNAYARNEINSIVEAQTKWEWCRQVDRNTEPLHPFDMMVFRIAKTDHHVGMYIWPGYMLHIIEGINAGIERYEGIRWKKQLHRVMRNTRYEKEDCSA